MVFYCSLGPYCKSTDDSRLDIIVMIICYPHGHPRASVLADFDRVAGKGIAHTDCDHQLIGYHVWAPLIGQIGASRTAECLNRD